jgi:hypothetical protein
VSYGDVVAAFHVDSERPDQNENSVNSAGEGMINREVNITITRTPWTRLPEVRFEFDGGIAGQGERLGGAATGPDGDAYRDVDGKNADEIGQLVSSAEPDPLAVKYADLPAPERRLKVVAEKNGRD